MIRTIAKFRIHQWNNPFHLVDCWTVSFRKQSLARFYDMKSSVRYMDFDERRKLMITVGPDHVIKIWKIASILTWVWILFSSLQVSFNIRLEYFLRKSTLIEDVFCKLSCNSILCKDRVAFFVFLNWKMLSMNVYFINLAGLFRCIASQLFQRNPN